MCRSWKPLLLIAALGACSSPVAPAVTGAWGGSEASLVIGSEGGSLMYACGMGTVARGWSVAADGSFKGAGQHFFGGGPIPITGRPPHPAEYSGQIDRSDERLTLTIDVVDQGVKLGPFVLFRDGPTVVERCL